jgi:prepilin-type N-terminal cleavage/methylation domain-containing protein
MRNRGFTLPEILVGLVIGAILTGGMLIFMSNASFTFHTQQDSINDRTSLKRAMMLMSTEVRELGFRVGDGQMSDLGAGIYFLDTTPVNGFDSLSMWRNNDPIEAVANDPYVPTYEQIVYQVEQRVDPVTLDRQGVPVQINVMTRRVLDQDGVEISPPQPFLFGITRFEIELGLDDGTWVEVTQPNLAQTVALRFHVATETVVSGAGGESAQPVAQELTQIVHLRSHQEAL